MTVIEINALVCFYWAVQFIRLCAKKSWPSELSVDWEIWNSFIHLYLYIFLKYIYYIEYIEIVTLGRGIFHEISIT